MLHCLQASDHRLDTRTHLLVLLQQGRTFARKAVEPLTQRAVLFAKLVHHRDQLPEALLEKLEFLTDESGLSEFVHAAIMLPSRAQGQTARPYVRQEFCADRTGDLQC